ncbi:Rieske (2Fe-2S) protein [Trueperella bialowiezensis]|uniref:Biphenyl dioxygenase ferredoxin subunit n=1 Tax=Trueperella bialowiezensis TaxID=312285 RepID=A0A448PBY3_9ACTO|nr:non-heme iron oxygenase ferredoxin subunit [Trueperella bialowiezensis]VEI12342.1 Biphenyl dioxygenase ferredoxin subunit [Trueperella bialowiezensis]
MPEYFACTVDEVAPGDVHAVGIDIPGKPLPLAVALVHAETGNWFAVDNRCSHGRFKLAEGYVDGETLECTRHGSAFDLHTGQPLNPPASAPVKTYQVRVDGDDVYITVN